MKNSHKRGAWHDEETREEPVDWYPSTFDELSSASGSESQRERRNPGRNYRWNGYSSWTLLVLNLFFVCATCRLPADSNMCVPSGLRTVGRTWPREDIILEHGQPLKIYCLLNDVSTDPNLRGRNASDLVFIRNDVLVEQDFITVINESAIVMYVEQPPPSADMYYCKLRLKDRRGVSYNKAVCLNKVMIGYKPEKPKRFSCVSHNWENLVCSWDPASNYIPTKFSLGFKLPGRAGRGGRAIYRCPEPNREDNLSPNSCVWDTGSDPIYRQVFEYYTFILWAENDLGTDTFTYKFHHWAHVIPSKPVNLHVVEKTSSSALLHWQVPFPMETFPPGLYDRISYRSQWDPVESWQTIDVWDGVHAMKKYFNITDLQYANAVYEVKVFLKSAKAMGEDMWSESSNVTFKTEAKLPGASAKTDIGSFETITGCNDLRTVYIYWQSIPAFLENGDDSTYRVIHVAEDGSRLDVQPQKITNTYAKLEGMGLKNLTFEIVAVNHVGASSHKATVHVPNQLEIPAKPTELAKIEFEGGIYGLSWNPPSNSNITDYTIFWCESCRYHHCECNGNLDWVHVSGDTRVHNVAVPDPNKVYKFAIATNTAGVSSGMVWFSTMTRLAHIERKVQNSVRITRLGLDVVEIGWAVDCRAHIDGFNIHYCPIVSPKNLTCNGPMITHVENDQRTTKTIVSGLKPYNTYMVILAIVSGDVQVFHSDPLFFTTSSESSSEIPPSPYTPSGPGSAPSIMDVLTMMERKISALDEFNREMKNDHVAANVTDCVSQLSNLAHRVSKFDIKLSSLLEEIRQLRRSGVISGQIL